MRLKIVVQDSPYTSKLGGDIDIDIFTEGMEYKINNIANLSTRDLRRLKRKIKDYLYERKKANSKNTKRL